MNGLFDDSDLLGVIISCAVIIVFLGIFVIVNNIFMGGFSTTKKRINEFERIILSNEKVHDLKVIQKYKKCNVFSDVFAFIPTFVIQCLFTIITIHYNGNDMLLALFILLIPCFIFIYLFSIKRVCKYNRFLDRAVLVEGKVLENPSLIEQGYEEAKIEVLYEYIDPKGISHSSRQRVRVFIWNVPYSKQLEKWKDLYYKGKTISVIVSAYEYKYSYLPMREDFCKGNDKIYLLDFYDFTDI